MHKVIRKILTVVVGVSLLSVVFVKWQERREVSVIQWADDAVQSSEPIGNMRYRYELHCQFDENGKRIDAFKPPGPVWIRSLLGNLCFARIRNLEIDCQANDFTDLDPLSQLADPKELKLRCSDTLENIDGLRGKHSLEKLVIEFRRSSRVESKTDMSALSTLTGLKTLRLKNCDGLQDLELLKNAPS